MRRLQHETQTTQVLPLLGSMAVLPVQRETNRQLWGCPMILNAAMAAFAFACVYITWEEISLPPKEKVTPITLNHDDFAAWERDL